MLSKERGLGADTGEERQKAEWTWAGNGHPPSRLFGILSSEPVDRESSRVLRSEVGKALFGFTVLFPIPAGSLCKRKTPECDKETSVCTDLDGVALCQCKSGYFQFNKMDHSCRGAWPLSGSVAALLLSAGVPPARWAGSEPEVGVGGWRGSGGGQPALVVWLAAG